jgi:hypothetical protein
MYLILMFFLFSNANLGFGPKQSWSLGWGQRGCPSQGIHHVRPHFGNAGVRSRIQGIHLIHEPCRCPGIRRGDDVRPPWDPIYPRDPLFTTPGNGKSSFTAARKLLNFNSIFSRSRRRRSRRRWSYVFTWAAVDPSALQHLILFIWI